jgi:hypothetical protein
MSTHTANTEAVINSPVGAVTVAIRGSPDVAIEVSAVPLPELPDGMIVDGVMLFLIRLASPVSQDLPVTFSASANQEGGPESGQWLDSMAFENARGIFQVAIRDDEWLAAQGIVAEPVSYGRHGFKLSAKLPQEPFSTRVLLGARCLRGQRKTALRGLQLISHFLLNDQRVKDR